MYSEFSKSNHRKKCIDGRITGSNKCVGYCTFEEHEGYLTKDLRKSKDCLKKGCRYYIAKEKAAEEPARNDSLYRLYISITA